MAMNLLFSIALILYFSAILLSFCFTELLFLINSCSAEGFKISFQVIVIKKFVFIALGSKNKPCATSVL
jgi:hypothetical protein